MAHNTETDFGALKVMSDRAGRVRPSTSANLRQPAGFGVDTSCAASNSACVTGSTRLSRRSVLSTPLKLQVFPRSEKPNPRFRLRRQRPGESAGRGRFACSAGDPHRSADRTTALPPASTACFPRSPASGEGRNRVCGRAHGSPHRRSILARRGAGSARHRSRTASARPARDEPRNASCSCWAGMSGRPVDRFGPRPFAHSTKKNAGPTFVARQFCSLTLGGGFSTFLFAS